jgi:plasmid stabilization system protein ParE
MAWEVIFSARSRNDLEQIVRYIARDDPEAAERFGSKLIERAESLGDTPEIGPVAAETGYEVLPRRFVSDRLPTRHETTRHPDSAILACCAPRTSDALKPLRLGSPRAHRHDACVPTIHALAI